MTRDRNARELWGQVYEKLSEGTGGMQGAVLSRAEAQVLRLSCIYALLDRSKVIQEPHLRAALALWDYAASSARCIFSNSLGDPIAAAVLRSLSAHLEGLAQTNIRDLFSRNQSEATIERALGFLFKHKLAHSRQEPGEGGRPTERWFIGPMATTKTT